MTFEEWWPKQVDLRLDNCAECSSADMETIARAGWDAAVSTRPEGLRYSLDNERQVFFYEQEFYVLSNFSAFRVRLGDLWFDTSEAAYHWHRFTQRQHQRAVLTAISAHEAFRYAQEHKGDQRPDWDAVKEFVMLDILRHKADQHEYVRRKLLETGERTLIENSWRDAYWGWGPNRDGRNMLGTLWMQVRAELRAQALRSPRGRSDG